MPAARKLSNPNRTGEITPLIRLAILFATAVFCAPLAAWAMAPPAEAPTPEAAASASRKIDRIRAAQSSGGSFGEVRLTELEANSYLAYELASSIPDGVSQIALEFHPGRMAGSTVVDFGRLKRGLGSAPNPIADFLLRGVHTIGAEGSVSGRNGVGQFQLERVLLDGVEVPQMVVDYLIEQYLIPRFPDAAINRPFVLPFSIDSFRTGTQAVVVTGKPSR